MGLFDFVKSQFIEVIEWTEPDSNTIVYRFPVQGKEIKMGAQLTVRESQVAIFVTEGQIGDIFQPGRYELQTQVLPILGKLKAWKYGFNSPFKSEVYFVNTHQFTDQKWGTQNPVMMRDKEFGMLRLRAFGIFSFKVEKPEVFMKELFGTRETYTVTDIDEQLRRSIVSTLTDVLGDASIPALDLAAKYEELSDKTREKMLPRVQTFGLTMPTFVIENISLPPEVEQVLDKRTSMGVIGDMQQYTQYQAAEALRDAAKAPGGVAGAGMGMGAGVALGQMFAQNLANGQANQQQAQQPQQPAASATRTCPKCGQQVSSGRFCHACGAAVTSDTVACRNCNKQIPANGKFCPECGASQQVTCTKCGAQINNAKFCPECGEKAPN